MSFLYSLKSNTTPFNQFYWILFNVNFHSFIRKKKWKNWFHKKKNDHTSIFLFFVLCPDFPDSVQYVCNNGYILDGKQNLSCADGVWSSHRPPCRGSYVMQTAKTQFAFVNFEKRAVSKICILSYQVLRESLNMGYGFCIRKRGSYVIFFFLCLWEWEWWQEIVSGLLISQIVETRNTDFHC